MTDTCENESLFIFCGRA